MARTNTQAHGKGAYQPTPTLIKRPIFQPHLTGPQWRHKKKKIERLQLLPLMLPLSPPIPRQSRPPSQLPPLRVEEKLMPTQEIQ